MSPFFMYKESIGPAFAKYHDSHACYPALLKYRVLLLIGRVRYMNILLINGVFFHIQDIG